MDYENVFNESNAERAFMTWWNRLNTMPIEDAYSVPVREFQFDKTRRWKFDFCWPLRKVALEVEGGVWSNGRHNRAKGYETDCEKYNRATELGWRILRFTPQMIEANPIEVIRQIERVLKA